MSALRYRVTYKDEAPTYHQNVNYVGKAIGRDQSVVSETLRGSGFLRRLLHRKATFWIQIRTT